MDYLGNINEIYNESFFSKYPEDFKDFEDAIRNAISIGGDSETIACIVGGLAEAYYGVTRELKKEVNNFLPIEFKNVINEFYERF